MDKIGRIKQLIEILNEASKHYYNGKSIMTDYEWDRGYHELITLEKETGVIYSNSPTQNVGTIVAKEQKKITHEHPMLSLAKIHSIDEIKKFINNKRVIASIKLDGLSLSCTYLNGDLIRLETRGNGVEGTDCLIHKNSIMGLPLHIKHKGKYIVDGECIVKYRDFDRINADLSDEEKFSNPRNMASGGLNLLDTNISAKRGLSFIVWNVIEDTENFSNSMIENFTKCSVLGFEVVPHTLIINMNDDELNDTLDGIKHIADAMSLPMDGCVWSYDDVEYGKSLGGTSHHFNSGVAYKYDDECAETILRDINWTIGKTGQLTPTAVFDTVELDQTEVSRASLHNVSICKSFKLGIGDTIVVKKSNQVIPQLQDNLTKSNTFKIPVVCPICGSKTEIVKENSSEVLICTNPDCKGKLLSKLTHFVSKDAINIDSLSEQTLQKFIDLGWIITFQDIYHLSVCKEEMYELEGFGKKSVDKLFAAIEKSRNTDLAHFLYSLSIPNIGKTASKDIAKLCNGGLETFCNLIATNENAFINIDGFGSIMNRSLRTWWQENNRMFVELSKEFNFEVKNKVKKNIDNEIDLSGKTFVITGSLEHYNNRQELVEIIEQLGAKVSNSVSCKTSYLINNDKESTSSKNKKAKELNIPIISEQDFINLLS